MQGLAWSQADLGGVWRIVARPALLDCSANKKLDTSRDSATLALIKCPPATVIECPPATVGQSSSLSVCPPHGPGAASGRARGASGLPAVHPFRIVPDPSTPVPIRSTSRCAPGFGPCAPNSSSQPFAGQSGAPTGVTGTTFASSATRFSTTTCICSSRPATSGRWRAGPRALPCGLHAGSMRWSADGGGSGPTAGMVGSSPHRGKCARLWFT